MTTNDISSNALLIDLRVSQWTARKIDKGAAREVAANHNAASTSGTYYKSLIDGSALETIKAVVGRARAYHYRMTLPWADTGPRVLKSSSYLEYMQEMRTYGDEFRAAVALLLQDYPLHRQEAKRLLGTMFNDTEYPDTWALADKFDFNLSVLPLPMGGDFRATLGDEAAEARIRAEVDASSAACTAAAMQDAFNRVAKIAEAFIDRLSKPDTVFRDSLVDNARELADVLPHLNITDDPALSALTQRMQATLCQYDPNQLRHNPDARKETYTAAVAVHKDVMAFFGGAMQ